MQRLQPPPEHRRSHDRPLDAWPGVRKAGWADRDKAQDAGACAGCAAGRAIATMGCTMTSSLVTLKKEEKRFRNRNAINKMRADARAVKPPPKIQRRPDTPEVLRQREASKAWHIANREKHNAATKIINAKKAMSAKERMAEAIRQADATRRNVESVEDDAL